MSLLDHFFPSDHVLNDYVICPHLSDRNWFAHLETSPVHHTALSGYVFPMRIWSKEGSDLGTWLIFLYKHRCQMAFEMFLLPAVTQRMHKGSSLNPICCLLYHVNASDTPGLECLKCQSIPLFRHLNSSHIVSNHLMWEWKTTDSVRVRPLVSYYFWSWILNDISVTTPCISKDASEITKIVSVRPALDIGMLKIIFRIFFFTNYLGFVFLNVSVLLWVITPLNPFFLQSFQTKYCSFSCSLSPMKCIYIYFPRQLSASLLSEAR